MNWDTSAEEFIRRDVVLQAGFDNDLAGVTRREGFQGRLPLFFPDRDDRATLRDFLQRLLQAEAQGHCQFSRFQTPVMI